MDPRTVPTAIGAGITTLILATGGLAVALPLALGVGSGVAGNLLTGLGGLLGLAFGLATGSAISWLVVGGFEEWAESTRRVVSGYAAFGLVFSAVFVLGVVAPAGVQRYLTLETAIGAGLVVGAVAHGLEYVRAVP